MKNILFIYPPFCTPATPPYSISNISSFLKQNLKSKKEYKIELIDLNEKFHNLKYPDEKREIKNILLKENYSDEKYQLLLKEFLKKTKKDYSKNNKLVLNLENPEYFDELFELILKKTPSFVCLSIVYSSQIFYAISILKKLKELNITSIVGGPLVNNKIIAFADYYFKNKEELMFFFDDYSILKNNDSNVNKQVFSKYFTKEFSKLNTKINSNYYIDYSYYDVKDYFCNDFVLPIKSSNTCYYKKCTFCTHYNDEKYFEFDLKHILKTIKNNKSKNFFFIDDMLSHNRILKLADILKNEKINFYCQIKPTSDYDEKTMNYLYSCGLRGIIFGVESGSDEILKLMRKGTNITDVSNVLKHSHTLGIKNILYIMFGFPKETKEDFLKTISFLKENDDYIDLISLSVFGLSKNSYIFDNPCEFGLYNIEEKERTYLDASISYENKLGLTQEQAKHLRNSHKKTIDNINKYPREMNFFREHMFDLISDF